MSKVTSAQQTVVGMFGDTGRAERALNALKEAGFTPEQVSVVAKDKQDVAQMSDNTEMVANSAAGGAVAGTFLGGLAGFLVGISALVIPGIGPIVGAGIIGSTLAGAGIGAATGGLIGALTAEGVHEEDARGYEESVKQGGILLSVRANGDAEAQRAQQAFQSAGGTDVRSYGRPNS
ncbi:MAG: general stress protein [Chloroflexia bacterium]